MYHACSIITAVLCGAARIDPSIECACHTSIAVIHSLLHCTGEIQCSVLQCIAPPSFSIGLADANLIQGQGQGPLCYLSHERVLMWQVSSRTLALDVVMRE